MRTTKHGIRYNAKERAAIARALDTMLLDATLDRNDIITLFRRGDISNDAFIRQEETLTQRIDFLRDELENFKKDKEINKS